MSSLCWTWKKQAEQWPSMLQNILVSCFKKVACFDKVRKSLCAAGTFFPCMLTFLCSCNIIFTFLSFYPHSPLLSELSLFCFSLAPAPSPCMNAHIQDRNISENSWHHRDSLLLLVVDPTSHFNPAAGQSAIQSKSCAILFHLDCSPFSVSRSSRLTY